MSDSPSHDLPESFAGAKPQISTFVQEFVVASDRLAHDKAMQETFDQRQDEIKLGDGMLTHEQVSRLINKSRVSGATLAEEKQKAERHDRFIFMALLDQIRDRVIELEERMAKRYETLRGKYGDNVIGSIASAFLSDEKLSELTTNDQRLRALADQFLDKSGNIKDKYKHLEEAKYVRDWYELQKLKPIVAKYDGRDDLTAKEKREVLKVAEATSLTENKNKLALSGNDAYQTTIDAKLDKNTLTQQALETNADFEFK